MSCRSDIHSRIDSSHLKTLLISAYQICVNYTFPMKASDFQSFPPNEDSPWPVYIYDVILFPYIYNYTKNSQVVSNDYNLNKYLSSRMIVWLVGNFPDHMPNSFLNASDDGKNSLLSSHIIELQILYAKLHGFLQKNGLLPTKAWKDVSLHLFRLLYTTTITSFKQICLKMCFCGSKYRYQEKTLH